MAETCPHDAYSVEANVNATLMQDGTVGARVLTVSVKCSRCGTPFWFPGCKTGTSYVEPVTDNDGFKLATPIVEANRRNQPNPSLTYMSLRNGDAIKGRWTR